MQLDPIQQAAQEQFARQSRSYGSGHILADTSDVAAALSLINVPSVARVLDVAAGAGHTGLHLASLGHHVILADIAAPMLERVREAAAERGLHVETKQHAAEDYPYADASFDLVTCRVAAHHFSSPETFIGETARVLRSGGCFLLIDGSVEDDAREAEAWIHRVEKLRDPSHARFLSPRAWKELCARQGLDVISAELQPMKQPDLEWYFDTAATPSANRDKVRTLVVNAPPEARASFRLGDETGRTVWWWHRLTLIAQKR